MFSVSRSSSIIIAYFIREKKLTIEESLKLIRVTRPQAQPNRGFLEQLKAYEEKHLTKKDEE